LFSVVLIVLDLQRQLPGFQGRASDRGEFGLSPTGQRDGRLPSYNGNSEDRSHFIAFHLTVAPPPRDELVVPLAD
jgi:hypothetical protein